MGHQTSANRVWRFQKLSTPSPPVPSNPTWAWYDDRSEDGCEGAQPRLALFRPQFPERFSDGNHSLLKVACSARGSISLGEGQVNLYWELGSPEPYLLALGFALGLESEGIPCFHASGIVVEGQAIALMANSQVGKSTLTTELLSRGHGLLTDDMLALWPTASLPASEKQPRLQPRISPGRGFVSDPPPSNARFCFSSAPQIRLWDDALALVEHWPTFARRTQVASSPGKFTIDVPPACIPPPETAFALSAIFVIEPSTQTHPTARRLHGAEALRAVISHTLIGGAARAIGVEERRFSAVGTAVNEIPVFEIQYPSGHQSIKRTIDLLEQLFEG